MTESRYCLTLSELVDLCTEILSYTSHEANPDDDWQYYVKLWLKEKKK